MAVRRAENGDDGQCPGRSGLRRPRRSATRHRLCDRCQGRARRQSRRRLPRQFARSDHLPGGGDCERQAGDAAISGVSAVCDSQIDIRGLRLLGAGKAHTNSFRLEKKPGVRARIEFLARQAQERIAEKRATVEEQLWAVLEADIGDFWETYEAAKTSKDGKLETDQDGKMLTVRKHGEADQ